MYVEQPVPISELRSIAIIGFSDPVKIGFDLNKQTTHLLNNSGQFKIYEISIEQQNSNNATIQNLEQWQKHGVDYVLIGNVRTAGEQMFQVDATLMGPRNLYPHFANQYKIEKQQLQP